MLEGQVEDWKRKHANAVSHQDTKKLQQLQLDLATANETITRLESENSDLLKKNKFLEKQVRDNVMPSRSATSRTKHFMGSTDSPARNSKKADNNPTPDSMNNASRRAGARTRRGSDAVAPAGQMKAPKGKNDNSASSSSLILGDDERLAQLQKQVTQLQERLAPQPAEFQGHSLPLFNHAGYAAALASGFPAHYAPFLPLAPSRVTPAQPFSALNNNNYSGAFYSGVDTPYASQMTSNYGGGIDLTKFFRGPDGKLHEN